MHIKQLVLFWWLLQCSLAYFLGPAQLSIANNNNWVGPGNEVRHWQCGMDYGCIKSMEWTDGMEYQLTKIAKIYIMAVAKL